MAKEKKEVGIASGSDKLSALKAAMDKIEKNFGKGSIMALGDRQVEENIEVIPTGSVGLNAAGAWWRSTGPNRQAKPPSPST